MYHYYRLPKRCSRGRLGKEKSRWGRGWERRGSSHEDLLAIDEVRISRCTSFTWHALTDDNATHLHDTCAPSCIASGGNNGAGAPPHGDTPHSTCAHAHTTLVSCRRSLHHLSCCPGSKQTRDAAHVLGYLVLISATYTRHHVVQTEAHNLHALHPCRRGPLPQRGEEPAHQQWRCSHSH